MFDIAIAIGIRECCPDISMYFRGISLRGWSLDTEWMFKFAVKWHLWMTYHLELGDDYMYEPEPDVEQPENIKWRHERKREGKVIREYYDHLHKDKDNLE